jgi:hypothetical protein
MLEEHQIFLSLSKKELKFREAKLVEEQARSLHSIDRRDLPAELEELRVWVAGVEDEHAAKAGELSALVVEASNALIDLMMIPIQDVPQHLKMAQEVLKAAGVILGRLREEHTFDGM